MLKSLPIITPIQFNEWTATGEVCVRALYPHRSAGVAKISIKNRETKLTYLVLVPMTWVTQYLPGGRLHNVK